MCSLFLDILDREITNDIIGLVSTLVYTIC